MQNPEHKHTHTYAFKTADSPAGVALLKTTAKQTIENVKKTLGDTNVDNIDITLLENCVEIMMTYHSFEEIALDEHPNFALLEATLKAMPQNVDLHWARRGISFYRLIITISLIDDPLSLPFGALDSSESQQTRTIEFSEPQNTASEDSRQPTGRITVGQDNPPIRTRKNNGSMLDKYKKIAAFVTIPVIAHSIWSLSSGL